MISVITWDAGFRESYHTVDFFSRQTLAKDKFEFIWAEYYSKTSAELRDKIDRMENGRIFYYQGTGKWHLGRCLNAAVKDCKGDILVIPDGDVAVGDDFLAEVSEYHSRYRDLVMYFRRFDQRQPAPDKSLTISALEKVCKLNNPTNYGGCLTIRRVSFEHVKGYEEHRIFSEAGANGKELYIRLKNAGFPIIWHPTGKIYHPWHTGTAPKDPDYKKKIHLQDLLIKHRDLKVDYLADRQAAQLDLQTHQKNMPSPPNSFHLLQKFKRAIFRLQRNL